MESAIQTRLAYAMNYGFIVMVWKDARSQGILMLALFVVQLVANFSTHWG